VLSILGYRVTGPNGTENQNIADEVREMVWRAPEEFDVFQENPWPVLCREVDERYSQAFREIAAHPGVFTGALLTGLVKYPYFYLQHLIAAGIWADESAPVAKVGVWVVALIPVAGLARAAGNKLLRPLAIFLGGSLLACVISLPFVYGNGGLRTMTVSIPFVAATFALALTALFARRKAFSSQPLLMKDSAYAYRLPMAISLAFVALVLAAPGYFHKQFPVADNVVKQPGCREGLTPISAWLGPGVPFVNLRPGFNRHSFVPEVSEKDFRRISPSNEFRTVWRGIAAPATLVSAFDIVSGQQKYLLGPVGMVPSAPILRHFCGSPSPKTGYLWFVSYAEGARQDAVSPPLGS